MNPQPEYSRNPLSGNMPSLQGVEVVYAPASKPELTFREIILNESSRPIDPKELIWANIYPERGIIAIGECQPDYRKHDDVYRGFVAEMEKEGVTISPDEPSVSCLIDRGTFSLRIEALKESCSYEQMHQLAAKYERAIQLAEARAKEKSGRVVLEADSVLQQRMAKILGRMNQVANINTSDVKLINNAIRGDKLPTDVRHVYDMSTGTRHFFVEDLEALARKAEFDRNAYPGEDLASALEKHRVTILQSISQLKSFLTQFNRGGHKEGQLFIVDPRSGERITSPEVLGEYVSEIFDLHESVASSPIWAKNEPHIIASLNYVIAKIKSACDPDFHAINTQSRRFVELVSQVLRNESPAEEPGRRFSTPLNPQEFGHFKRSINGDKEFVVTTTDLKLRNIANWLFGGEAGLFLDANGYPFKPSEADYICIYKPKTNLTFEPHPPDFVRRLGDLPSESFVVEFGKLNGQSSRLILKENEYGPTKWPERLTPTVKDLLEHWLPLELTEFVRDFKETQHSLFNSTLEAIREKRVKLAPRESWVSIYGPSANKAEIIKNTCNYRAMPWVEGPRSDLMNFRKLSFSEQRTIVEMDADVSAAGILAGLPHLQRRDLIIHRDQTTNSLSGGTFLSATESFCHSTGMKVQEYLKYVVPILYGNHIARRLAPLGYSSDVEDPAVLHQRQEQLIEVYTSRIRTALLELSTDVSAGGNGSKEVLLQALQSARNTHSSEPSWWRPKMFKPKTFLRFTHELLNMKREEIDAACEEIAATAQKEVRLIERIAPIPESGVTVEELEQVERCADRVSSLIGTHLLKHDYLNEACSGLENLAEANLLTILERTWYITALDVNMRIAELHKKREAAPVLTDIFSKARDGGAFYNLLKGSSLHIGLSYETLSACYDAVHGLKTVYNEVSTDRDKIVQLEAILSGLQPLGKLITG